MNQPQQQFPYQYNVYEPSIFVELYLPKKALYQGALYEALTKGFELDDVRQHFKENKDEIIKLMKNYHIADGLDKRLDEIETLAGFYKGYSMYEVDGVFSADDGTIFEERTQVIRVIFRPDIDVIRRITASMPERKSAKLVKRALQINREDKSILHEQLLSEKQIEAEEEQPVKELIEYVNNWKADVGLFLFGYIIFKICHHIERLNQGDPSRMEKEIWMASFWDCDINRVLLKGHLTEYPHGS